LKRGLGREDIREKIKHRIWEEGGILGCGGKVKKKERE
jgi:hypothetical protein